MDFLDPAKKRAMRRRLIAGYGLIAIAIALVTLILVFQSYGYDLDRKTGSIIQNGLLFVSSQPEKADIFVNGRQLTSQDNARLVLPSDVYKVELKRSGYRIWEKTVSLAGGGIERLLYPFLFPIKLDTVNQKTYAAQPTFATESPDRRWIIVQEPAQPAAFDVFDTADFTKNPTVINLPSGLLADSSQHHFSLVEWSTDNRHVLLKDTYPTGSQFIMVDRQEPTSSYSVSTVFKQNPTEVALHDKKYDQLYLYDQAKQTLGSANLKTAVVTAVATDVLAFKPYGSDIILYATAKGASPGMVRIMYHDGDGSFLLREVPVGSSYLLALAQYSGDWYVAVGSSPDGRLYIYKDPQPIIKVKHSDDKLYPTAVLRLAGANWLDFSANTQFLALQAGQKASIYDFERQRTYNFSFKQAPDEAAPNASWMDGNRLLLTSGGKTLVSDYDGDNQQLLTANTAGTLPLFDRDYKLLFNIAPAVGDKPAGPFALTRTDLIATPANRPKQ